MVHVHAFHGGIQVKCIKEGTGCTEILGIVHSVVDLALHSVQVGDRPFDFKAHGLSFFVLCMFKHFLRQIDSLNVLFECGQGLAVVEHFLPVIDLRVDFFFFRGVLK